MSRRLASSTTKSATGFSSGLSSSSSWHWRRWLEWYSYQLEIRPLITKGITAGLIAGMGDFFCQAMLASVDPDPPPSQQQPRPSQQDNNDNDSKTATAVTIHQHNDPRGRHGLPDWWNPKKTASFVFLGMLLAPALHVWYYALHTRLVPGPAHHVSVLIRRVLMDQFVYTPIIGISWLSLFWTLESMYEAPATNNKNTSTGSNNSHNHLQPRLQSQDIFMRLKQTLPHFMIMNWCLWIPAQLINFRFVPIPYQVLYSNMISLVWNMFLSYATRHRPPSSSSSSSSSSS